MTSSLEIFSVLIVEDHDLVRDALTAMVERHARLTLAGQADNGADAISIIERSRVDIAIVDFALPDMTGLEVISKARTIKPTTRHLILTGSPMDDGERAHLAQFAEGFLHKEAGRDALLSAIIKTAEERPIDIRNVSESDGNMGFVNSGALTKRERSVLREIARGHAMVEIAAALGISPSTVRKHRENIMMKLKLNSTAQLVRAAMQIGQY